ncbi:MAG: hypothetical protein JWO82_528 [Akkermansiaceae bacterium]|nr:hypothetical protein [Akkermansiaceae bacterium]
MRTVKNSARNAVVLAGMGAMLWAAPGAGAADRDDVEDSDFTKKVVIAFDGTTAAVTNEAGVAVSYGGSTSAVVINSTVEGVEYVLSGTATGYVEITSTYASKVTLDGVALTSGDGPALSMLSAARSYVVLNAGTSNVLADAATGTRKGSGALNGSGPLIISGRGALSIQGNKSHGISSATYVRGLGGEVTITGAVKDGVHANAYFQMDQGSLAITASGDGIDADEGYVVINGGSITVRSAVDDTKGIKCDGTLAVNGGSLNLTVDGVQSKALSSKGDMTLSGGSLLFNLAGGVFLETVTGTTSTYVDPSYSTAIKCDGNLAISGGSIAITHTGTAGKGISADGNIVISGGTVDIATSGGSSTSFTNSSGALDMAAADCLKADGTLTITGGDVTATSSGAGGDAISCDGAAVIGTLGIAGTPVISANTTGAHVLLSGAGMNADYLNAKAFSAGGNVTMNGGVFTATTRQDGGEGMESKANLTINGGTVEIAAYDDCINATTKVTINGGNIYCYSSGNDGIDSNGTMLITGGTIVSSGTNSPEESFDCDQNNFTITGGTMVGTGGATSTPTASTSTQRSVVYRGAGTVNVVLVVKSASGNVVVYELPRTYAGGGGGGTSSAAMTMLFSNAGLVAGTTYTILSGATVSGGTEFHGLYTGATVTGGTTLKTFTPTSMVTTVQ